jgi:hypothetical protein
MDNMWRERYCRRSKKTQAGWINYNRFSCGGCFDNNSYSRESCYYCSANRYRLPYYLLPLFLLDFARRYCHIESDITRETLEGSLRTCLDLCRENFNSRADKYIYVDLILDNIDFANIIGSLDCLYKHACQIKPFKKNTDN